MTRRRREFVDFNPCPRPQLLSNISQSGNEQATLNPTRNGFILVHHNSSISSPKPPHNLGEVRKATSPFRKIESNGDGRSSPGNASWTGDERRKLSIRREAPTSYPVISPTLQPEAGNTTDFVPPHSLHLASLRHSLNHAPRSHCRHASGHCPSCRGPQSPGAFFGHDASPGFDRPQSDRPSQQDSQPTGAFVRLLASL